MLDKKIKKNCDENKNISSLYKTSICPNDAEQLLFYFLEEKQNKKKNHKIHQRKTPT